MKKLIVLLFFAFVIKGYAQNSKNIFSKDPIINLENFQKKRVYYGFFLGFNSYDFKIDYKTVGPDILIKKTTGFNVGIVGDLKLQEYINKSKKEGLDFLEKNKEMFAGSEFAHNFLSNNFETKKIPCKTLTGDTQYYTEFVDEKIQDLSHFILNTFE